MTGIESGELVGCTLRLFNMLACAACALTFLPPAAFAQANTPQFSTPNTSVTNYNADPAKNLFGLLRARAAGVGCNWG